MMTRTMFRSSFMRGGARVPVNLHGAQEGEEGRLEGAPHMGAPRDICSHAAIDGREGASTAAPGSSSAGDALRAVGRRLSSPFRGCRGHDSAPATAVARQTRERSNWWFLLPIFLHATGGIVAFFILREDDVRRARNCLYLGLSLTALMFAPLIVLAALVGSPGLAD